MESWRAAGHRQCYKGWGGRERTEGTDRRGRRVPRKEGVGRGEGGRGVSGSSGTGVGDGLRILGQSVVREAVLVNKGLGVGLGG